MQKIALMYLIFANILTKCVVKFNDNSSYVNIVSKKCGITNKSCQDTDPMHSTDVA